MRRAEPEHNLCEHAWILLFSRDQGLCYLEQIYSARHDILNRLVHGQAGDIERECLGRQSFRINKINQAGVERRGALLLHYSTR